MNVVFLKNNNIFAANYIKSNMFSSINNRYSPSFGLINTFVLVSSDILLERERERERERRRRYLIIIM